MVQAINDNYNKLTTEQLLNEAQRKNKALTEERLSAIETESKLAEREAKRQETGGFWDFHVGESLEEAGNDFLMTFGGDEKSVSEAMGNYESLVHGLFDPQSLLSGFSSGLLPPDVVSLDRQFGDAASPASIVERVADPNQKDPYGSRACQRGIIQATAAAAAQTVAGAIGNAARALKTVQTSIGFLKSSIPDLGAAFMNQPVQSLLAIIGSQDLILKKMISVTKQIINVVDDMSEKDYPADHAEFIRRQQLLLIAADQKLSALEARLFAGASFNQSLWDGAKKNIDDAAKALCTFDLDVLIGGLTFKPFILLGLVIYLETLNRILKRQQAIRNRLSLFLLDFDKQFLDNLHFDNLFLPVINLIRCRLKRIIEDMDATIEKNRFVFYLLKEKQWCLELKALSALMKLSNKLKLPTNINRFLGTEALIDAANKVFDFVGSQEKKLADASVVDVIAICDVFTHQCRRKMVVNLPSAGLVSLGHQLILACQNSIGNSGAYGGVLNVFSGSVATYAAEAVLVLGQILEFAEERKLSGFVTSVNEGDLSTAFGLDSLTTSLEGQLVSLVSKTTAIARANGGNPVAEFELSVVTQTFQDETRNLGLVDQLTNDNASSHIEAQLEVEAPKYKSNEAHIQRAAKSLDVSVTPADSQFIDPKTAKLNKLKESVA